MASEEERKRIIAEYLAQGQQDDDDDDFDDEVIEEEEEEEDDDFQPGAEEEDEEEDDDGDDDDLPLLQGSLTYDREKRLLFYQGGMINHGVDAASENTFSLSSTQPLHFDVRQPTSSDASSSSKSSSFPPSARNIDMSGQLGPDKIDHLQFTISIPTLLKRGYDDDDEDDDDGGGKKPASSKQSNQRHALKDDEDDGRKGKGVGGKSHSSSKSNSKRGGKNDESAYSVHAVGTLESGRGFQFQGQFSDPSASSRKGKSSSEDDVPLVCQLRYDEKVTKVAPAASSPVKSPPVAAAAKRRYDDDDDDDDAEEEADEGVDYKEIMDLYKEAGTPLSAVLGRTRRTRSAAKQAPKAEHASKTAPIEAEDGQDDDEEEEDDDYKEDEGGASKPSSKRSKPNPSDDDDDDDVGF